ncbi:hypothetical protein JX265_003651 [Neoarthrinium moseri]|uniref:DUF1961 family protein n=1 Tax=Neoarthrinium moseri TaxID=1658444 RepID=A0A9P9WSH6_9PEZI|nr:uncharacterized protein JN550_002396 [Neoarthrinium moseri]KAI1854025.1 hypothetical protein JX266_001166 [Neoarthrinium moseri]KAI1874967.1 hypothetical protein JN550_002396 [Neoarthrinium moseri]KAI1877643.1 hypothetical protein JX265_003651 [Neoarthrinium moseri]
MPYKLLYRNPLASAEDVASWVPEGSVNVTTANSAGTTSVQLSSAGGIDDHFTLWCPEVFPSQVRITWEFSPVSEPGLAMLFFGAASVSGGGIFDEGVARRTGAYPQYHSSDIRALHVSYFRRRWPDERAFHTCNLRKSPGFHLVAQGADPLPPVADAKPGFYKVEVIKSVNEVIFKIDGLLLFRWIDDDIGKTGPVVEGGRIGFRQMAPLQARYRNLEVWELET